MGGTMTLYISDLDGTLLSGGAKLKPRTAAMLTDFIENGVNFTYCTARSINSAARIMEKVSLRLPVVLMNGVFIYDTVKNEYIVKNFPKREQQELLRETVIRLGETPMIHSLIDGEIRNSFLENAESIKCYVNDRKDDKRMRPVKSYEDMFSGEIFYAVFINPVHKDELDRVFTAENGFAHVYYADVDRPDNYWYEVFSITAGKANAVMQLKSITGADEIVCFGDNGNDLPMFSVSDRCYAVANAIEEVKAAADGVIGSNEEYGVTEFIQKETITRFDYAAAPKEEPDKRRFSEAVKGALERKRTTIGTLNEKTIHNALKRYYGGEIDHEAKIGGYYADAAGENGIYEIQTGSFGKLRKKLSKMLRACHVTVVYPFEARVRNYSMNRETGELISSSVRSYSSYSKLFLELYRIKEFLTNPNLTILIAELEIEKKTIYEDSRRIRKRGLERIKTPVSYIKEIRLENKTDYLRFLPEGLSDSFVKKDIERLRCPTDASLLLEILEFVGAVRRVGKRGNEIVYEIVKD